MKTEIFTHSEPDPIGQMLGNTGFNRFESVTGMCGLAKERGDTLEVLAVSATHKGRGEFREFIKLAQQHYQTVCVWFDENPLVGQALQRYGFNPERTIDGRGEPLIGWRWDKKLEGA